MRIFEHIFSLQTDDNQDVIVTVERYDMDTIPSNPDAESFVSSCWLLSDDFLPRPGSSLFLVVVFPISLLIYRCSSVNAIDSWFELLHKLAGISYASPSFRFHLFGTRAFLIEVLVYLLSFFMSCDSSSGWRFFHFFRTRICAAEKQIWDRSRHFTLHSLLVIQKANSLSGMNCVSWAPRAWRWLPA